jgi:hypothetical protein
MLDATHLDDVDTRLAQLDFVTADQLKRLQATWAEVRARAAAYFDLNPQQRAALKAVATSAASARRALDRARFDSDAAADDLSALTSVESEFRSLKPATRRVPDWQSLLPVIQSIPKRS